MRRPTMLAAALLIAAPLFAADAPKTNTPQPETAATQDSPLVAAAKAAAKARKGKAIVITNDTLARTNGAAMTTTESQPPITLPNPDPALLEMRQKTSQQQASSVQAARPSPAEAERQRRIAERAARAEDAGPYSDNPYLDERTIAAAQNPTYGTTQNPTNGTTQNPSYGTTQNPSYGTTQNPTTGQTQPSPEPKKP